MSERKLFKLTDFVIIAVLLVCSFSYIIYSKNNKKNVTAEIICSGETAETVDLGSVSDERDISLCDGRVIIHVEKGAVYFKDSDCRDKLCIKAGKLENPGDTAACLPERVVISLTGEAGTDAPDIISY